MNYTDSVVSAFGPQNEGQAPRDPLRAVFPSEKGSPEKKSRRIGWLDLLKFGGAMGHEPANLRHNSRRSKLTN